MSEHKAKTFPKHIAIIPDGNRRWAISNGLKKSEGYTHGLSPGIVLFEQCLALGVREVTFYGFTSDNTKRPSEQTRAFQKACIDAVEEIRARDASILVVGNSDSPLFPEELRGYLTRASADPDKIKINFLINYDWHWDLTAPMASPLPVKRRKEFLASVASAEISRVDLVIRWGGRRRLSGMLPIQTVYSDFYVVDDMWPDYCPDHLSAALDWYSTQDVTLGG